VISKKPFKKIASGLVELVKEFFEKLLQIIYPSFCLFCSDLVSPDDVACDSCLKNIRVPATVEFKVAESKVIKVYALSEYEGPIRSLLMGKLNGNISSSKRAAKLVMRATNFNMFDQQNINDSILVPIPLHWTRKLWRGFNQSSAMAEVYSEKTGIPVVNLLCKIKKTEYQSVLSKSLRAENVKNAFKLSDNICEESRRKIEGKKIIIVDDLCTTGSTLVVAAKILFKLKPRSVAAAVTCRVLGA
jgi:competence protein ComFC